MGRLRTSYICTVWRLGSRFGLDCPVRLGLKIGASQVGIRETGYLGSQVDPRDLLAVDWVSIGRAMEENEL